MGFRDENGALRARIQTLESEKERLVEDKKRLVEDKKRLVEGKIAKPDEELELVSAIPAAKSPDAGSVLAHVAKRNAKEQVALRRASSKEAKIRARLKKRRGRVQVERLDEGHVVTIAGGALADRLREGAELSLFMFFLPGVIVMGALLSLLTEGLGLGRFPALVASVVTWVLILTFVRVLWALWKSPPYQLRITGEHFALFKRGKKPVLLGKLSELKLVTTRANSAMLHMARFSDGRGTEDLDLLTGDDVRKLESLQPEHSKKSKSGES